MKIILKEKIEKLGVLGDIVNVKNGYARNFLIPFGKAVKATKENIKFFESKKVELIKYENDKIEKYTKIANDIQDKTYVIKANTSDGGKLFGSVNSTEIAKIISNESGNKIGKNQILLPKGVIRTIGNFKIKIYLYTDIYANVNLNVISSDI